MACDFAFGDYAFVILLLTMVLFACLGAIFYFLLWKGGKLMEYIDRYASEEYQKGPGVQMENLEQEDLTVVLLPYS